MGRFALALAALTVVCMTFTLCSRAAAVQASIAGLQISLLLAACAGLVASLRTPERALARSSRITAAPSNLDGDDDE